MNRPEFVKPIWLGPFLRINQLQFVRICQSEWRSDLRADTKPINMPAQCLRSIGFHRDIEPFGLQRGEQPLIDLKKRLAASENDHAFMLGNGPTRGGGISENSSGIVFRAADKIRVTESANRCRPILFPAGPEIATSKSNKHGGAPDIRAFALNGIENLFDGIGHAARSGVQRSICRDARVSFHVVTAYREALVPSMLSPPAATAIAMRFAEFTRAT